MAWLLTALLVGSILVEMEAQSGIYTAKKSDGFVRLEQVLQSPKSSSEIKEFGQANSIPCVVCEGIHTSCLLCEACEGLGFPEDMLCEAACEAACEVAYETCKAGCHD